LAEHVYKTVELTGTSTTTVDDAVRNALDRASKTIRNMRWFEIVQVRGGIEQGELAHWQVTLKLGFTLED
jgi:flavin-binding protein dodecin